MKSFFKTVFATFFALVIFCGCLALLGIGIVAVLARLGASKQTLSVPQGAYLVMDMSINLTDAPPPSDGERIIAKLLGNRDVEPMSVRQALGAISAAASDDRIKGIFLHGAFKPAGYGSGFAAIKEVREALMDFQTRGKVVTGYLVEPTARDYYLASVAKPLYVNPFGQLELVGLGTRPMFYADAFQKYGIGVQVTRVGKYKSFVEPYIRSDMSPESREQTQVLLDDVWGQFKAGVEAARKGVTADGVQALADSDGLINPETAKARGLVDQVAYLPDVLEELGKTVGRGDDGSFLQVDLAAYAKEIGAKGKKEGALGSFMNNAPKLAIVYAEGEIVDGEGDSDGMIGGDRFARRLRKLRNDPQIKAVVLRVNSPGGSAVASEVIQRELVLLRDAGKPVIVSMGTVAASGGYWITTAADRVYAEPNTITGSIGVFGILPNVQKLANDHGITFDEVKTGKFANLISISRPKTDEELKIVQNLVDHIYDQFVNKVAAARKLPLEKVKEIAQGRVWSGTKAHDLGLVDEIGGLESAIAFAKEKGKLAANVRIVEYPAPQDFAEKLAEAFSDGKRPLSEAVMGRRPDGLTQGLERLQSGLDGLRLLNDPKGVYARLPFDLKVD